MYFRNSFYDKKRNLLSLHDKETNIQEKYINLLNENINHELNTPISIIRSKVDKIQDIFKKIIDKNEKTVTQQGCVNGEPTYPEALSISISYELQQLLDVDVPVINHAIEAITTVMARTNNWKQIKYSNGNTSIYDIIYNVKQSLGNFTRSNIRYVISDNLKNITLSGDYKNGDLQLCLMNHIKNSSEAKANLIQFEGGLNENKNILSLYVIDNGDGIRNKNGKIIEPNRFEKVFDPYYSTKSDEPGEPCIPRHIIHQWYCNIKEYLDNYFNLSSMNTNPSTIKQIRGIGTYLNRTTLRNCGGDLKIMETSEQGTVFKITTFAKVKD
jgi:signal transduction histidine kinase